MAQTPPKNELQYVVGIDLGTSNCAVAYAALADARELGLQATSALPIAQLIAPGEVAEQPLLASCVYLPGPHELADGALSVPFAREPAPLAAGAFARDQGARVPGRLVASAKSWLCHPSVDRRSDILPPGAPSDVARLSPVTAQALLLTHLRDVWDHRFPDAPLAQQRVVLAVPASFDAIARKLTIEAAEAAGIAEHLVLIEEPQAAFYDFHARQGETLAADNAEHLVLVVDVGGGTTDLTLISLAWNDDGSPRLRRLAVGDHILLGGDNMDMTLARTAEQRMKVPGGRLDPARWGLLTQSCRMAKEAMLSGADDAPDTWTLTVPGRGSRLIRGSLKCELSRAEVCEAVLDGFLPPVAPDARPARAVRSGLAQVGLPYERDPGLTRHIAAFLDRHCQERRPDAVLLNGGVFRSGEITDRLLLVLRTWGQDLALLEHGSLDAAVAHGAAVYGLVEAGIGTRIGGGSAHAYYAEVASDVDHRQAVCLIPRGHEVGEAIVLKERTFELMVGQPVQFLLHETSSDRTDEPGEVIELADDEFHPLPPIQTLLESEGGGKARVPVWLSARLSEIGALEVACLASDDERRWELEFDLRGGEPRSGSGGGETLAGAVRGLPPGGREKVAEELQVIYGKSPRTVDSKEVRALLKTLGKRLGESREAWSLPMLREIWTLLEPGMKKRRRTPDHEVMFYSLAGYLLRPGFGFPLDHWRVQGMWRLMRTGIEYHKEPRVWTAWWVMWRRVAAGLDAGQQRHLLAQTGPWLRPEAGPRPSKREPGGKDEMLRLIASLERLDPATRASWGTWTLERLEKGLTPALHAWCLARLGARVPFTGSVHNVVDPEIAADWVDRLLRLPWKKMPDAAFAAAHIARLTDDRLLDLDHSVRARAANRLQQTGQTDLARMVREVTHLEQDAARRFVGDSLPTGLRI